MLPLLSSDEVVARLSEHVAPGAALAFDADDTLWSGDIGIDTFERVLEGSRVRPEAAAALRRDAENYGVVPSADPTETARSLYGAWKSGVYPSGPAFEMMAWVFAGYRVSEARDFCLGVVDEVGLAARVHPEIVPVLRWAKERGVHVLVVSASSGVVVGAAVERLALPVTEIMAMRAAVDGGVIAPRVVPPSTFGPGKVEALRAGAHAGKVIGAFGDSVHDLPMLREARVGVTVRPGAELREKAAAGNGIVELAPA